MRSIAPTLLAFQAMPAVHACVRTLETSWPCDISDLHHVLRKLPRLRRVSFWITLRPGRSDTLVMSFDNITRDHIDGGSRCKAQNAWLIAQPDLFRDRRLLSEDPQRSYSEDPQRFLDVLRLFTRIDTLFLDGGRGLFYRLPFGLRYPQNLDVGLLFFGRHFFPIRDSTSKLMLNVLCRRGVSAVYMQMIYSYPFVDRLVKRSCTRNAEAIRISYGMDLEFGKQSVLYRASGGA
jgi:hypothetical protein